MVSKTMRFCLITTIISNIIFFTFALFLRILPYYYYDYIMTTNNLMYSIFNTFEKCIFFYNMLIFTKVDGYIFYKIYLTLCIVVNILFLDIIIKKKYSTWIYFLYIMTSISLLVPVYLNIFGVLIYRYTFEILDYLQILNIIFYEIIIDNFFYHIIFFLEIILPIVYFKNYK